MIGIIILNYNSWELTLECIKSIESTTKKEYCIYVVDNQSTQKMPEEFLKIIEKDNLKFIQAEENNGYSAGNNLGLLHALNDGCDYFLISNSDVIYHVESIEKMKEYLDQNSEVGIVGPKVYLTDGSIQDIDMLVKTTLSTKYGLIFGKTPFKYFFNDTHKTFSKDKDDVDESFKVHSVSGCCFMMSKTSAIKLIPFDEVPFLYEEEVIIGINMEKIGLQTIYLTDSVVTHHHGQTTKNLKSFSYIEFVRSEVYYLREYMGNNKIQIIPLILIRFIKYLKNMITSKDYRLNFKDFFKRGLEYF